MRDKIQLQGIPTPFIWVPRPFLLQEINASALSSAAGLSQRIQIAQTLRVTKVELYLSATSGPVTLEIAFSLESHSVDFPGLGPPTIGPSTSAQVSLPFGYWVTFVWTAARPLLPPGDVYLLCAVTSAPNANWYYSSAAGGTRFQDSTRCAYITTTPRPNDDFAFRIFP